MENSNIIKISEYICNDVQPSDKTMEKSSFSLKDTNESPDEPRSIDDIQKWVDKHRRYERMLVWLWLIPVTLSVPCAYMNVMLGIYVPQYTCHLPTTPNNVSQQIWEQTILVGNNNVMTRSNCKMYDFLNFTYDNNNNTSASLDSLYSDNVQKWLNQSEHERLQPNLTECMFGLDVSTDYVTGTTSRENDWVDCSSSDLSNKVKKNIYSIKSNVLKIAQLGNLVGAIIFGAMADRFGRLKVLLFLSLKMSILGSINAVLTNTWIILIIRFIISLGLPATYQVLLITALEQVSEDKRAMVGVISSLAYSVGQSLLGIYAWMFDWTTLSLITSLPGILVIIATICLVEESPRWLVARGKLNEASKVLQRIARNNRLKISKSDIKNQLIKANKQEQVNKEIYSCEFQEEKSKFSVLKQVLKHHRLSLRVALIIINWTVNLQMYMGPMLRYATISPNPLTGWAVLSGVEIPACILVYGLLQYMGRRTVHVFFMILSTIALVGVSTLIVLDYSEDGWHVYGLVIAAKLGASITFMIIYLQSAELLPTAIRTSVTGVASLVAIACCIATPDIMHHMNEVWMSYLMIAGFGVIGMITAILLPDTTGRHLPQTLEEAEHFS